MPSKPFTIQKAHWIVAYCIAKKEHGEELARSKSRKVLAEHNLSKEYSLGPAQLASLKPCLDKYTQPWGLKVKIGKLKAATEVSHITKAVYNGATVSPEK